MGSNLTLAVVIVATISVSWAAIPADAASTSGIGERPREDHPPIQARGDADLALPDEVSGNGVRGGAGTASDPWRISDWRIEAEEGPAIDIRGVQGYVLIENVEVITRGGPDQDDTSGILIARAPHVQMKSIRSAGVGGFGSFSAAGVQMEDIVIRNSDPNTDGRARGNGEPSISNCIFMFSSKVEVAGMEVTGRCGISVFHLLQSEFTATDLNVTSFSGGISATGERTKVDIRSSTFRPIQPANWSVQPPHLEHMTVGRDAQVFLGAGPPFPESISITGTEISDYSIGCLHVADIEREDPSPVSLHLEAVDLRCRGNAIWARAAAGTLTGTDVTIRGSYSSAAIRTWGIDASFQNLSIVGPDVGVEASDGADISIRKSSLLSVALDATTDPESKIVFHDSRFDALKTEGNVVSHGEEVIDADAPGNPVPGPPLIGLTVMLAGLGIAIRSRRGRLG